MNDNESSTGKMNLKKLIYDIACRPLCRFYKEGQEDDPEETECGAWEILSKHIIDGSLTVDELRKFSESIKDEVDMTGEKKPPFTSLDQSLVEKICRPLCEFYAEDQEHREKDYQCGAYKLIKTLITSKRLNIEDVMTEETET
ncbi:MAG: hypothetical protein ACFFCD_14705 [Promethearchaeota archaeon]